MSEANASPKGAEIAAERGERSQSKKKIHGAKKHRHNLTPAKLSAAKPLKVVKYDLEQNNTGTKHGRSQHIRSSKTG